MDIAILMIQFHKRAMHVELMNIISVKAEQTIR